MGALDKLVALARKVSKTAANYRQADGQASCGTCSYFDGEARCSRVSGQISPDMVSDIYEPASATPALSRLVKLNAASAKNQPKDSRGRFTSSPGAAAIAAKPASFPQADQKYGVYGQDYSSPAAILPTQTRINPLKPTENPYFDAGDALHVLEYTSSSSGTTRYKAVGGSPGLTWNIGDKVHTAHDQNMSKRYPRATVVGTVHGDGRYEGKVPPRGAIPYSVFK